MSVEPAASRLSTQRRAAATSLAGWSRCAKGRVPVLKAITLKRSSALRWAST